MAADAGGQNGIGGAIAQSTGPGSGAVAPGLGVDRASAARLTRAQKAAIVLSAIGPESSAQILERMDESDFQSFARAMSELGQISQETANAVIDEFLASLGVTKQIKGGLSEAKRLLVRVLDEDSVARIIEDVEGPRGRTVWEKLSNCSDEALATYLSREHPQSAAVVISKLRPEKAAKVLQRLSEEQVQQILLRMSRVPRLDRHIVDEIKRVLQRDFLETAYRQQVGRRPADVIGSILTNMPSTRANAMLGKKREQRPRLADSVQRVMFTFSDIPERIAVGDLQKVLRSIENEDLVRALAYAAREDSAVYGFFLRNMPKRAAEQLEEEIGQVGDLPARDGEAAQALVIQAIQSLADANEIKIIEPEVDDDDLI